MDEGLSRPLQPLNGREVYASNANVSGGRRYSELDTGLPRPKDAGKCSPSSAPSSNPLDAVAKQLPKDFGMLPPPVQACALAFYRAALSLKTGPSSPCAGALNPNKYCDADRGCPAEFCAFQTSGTCKEGHVYWDRTICSNSACMTAVQQASATVLKCLADVRADLTTIDTILQAFPVLPAPFSPVTTFAKDSSALCLVQNVSTGVPHPGHSGHPGLADPQRRLSLRRRSLLFVRESGPSFRSCAQVGHRRIAWSALVPFVRVAPRFHGHLRAAATGGCATRPNGSTASSTHSQTPARALGSNSAPRRTRSLR
jgi:hypothetical protein